ncbi:hypothetical protein LNAOJCKE_3256 [Methylorubrum aminovorans]|uniref:Uncharacterized protein n=1 Tax=Methylorubrum aminovorans TaxID=269069 RepID=A0ABQ4UGW6_9HYPH|nr:hypothetical protein [Methylorubrum aminovorans]GJE66042.1 hypothetical protein LNAOJCKE_3256 [Methylorubrum aminovorans]GMA78014.1 hypothetical protein GCM10025880_44310 [Methylorubrum aminovorans]
MIALIVLAAAIANVTLVVMLAERFGSEGGMHVSAGEMTSIQATHRAPATAVRLANENTIVGATKIAA